MSKKPTYEELARRVKILEKELTKCNDTEKALREKLARYREIASSIPGVVYQFLLKKDGSYSSPYISECAGTILDISADEIMADAYSLFNMIVEEDLNSVNQSIAESAHTMKTWLQEFRIRDNAGKIRWIRATSTPHLLPNGEILWDGVLLDISDRIQVEEELVKHREHFEELVKERTAEQTKTNESLKHEVIERKQTEQALQSSYSLLTSLMESSSDVIIFSVDRDYKYTFFNTVHAKEMKKLWDVDIETGKNLLDYIPNKEERERLRKNFKRILNGKRFVKVEEYSGPEKRFYYESAYNPIFDKKDNVIGLTVFSVDVTKRKNAEKILKESEEKFKNLAENSPNMIFINQKGRVVYANKKCEEIMGYKKEEFYSSGFNFLCLIALESLDLIKDNFRRHMNGEEVAPHEYSLISKEGKEIEGIITTRLIKYEGEDAILGIVTDITERKQSERALQISEERYRSLVENINVGITLIDNDYNIIMTNTAQCGLFNKDPGAFVGKKCYQEFEKKDNVCAHCPGTLAMSSGLPQEVETVGILDDGTRFWAWIRAFPIFGPDNKPTGFIEVVEDITERKRAEESLIQAKEEWERTFDAVPDAIMLLDKQYRIVRINKTMANVVKLTPEECVGQTCYKLIHGIDKPPPFCLHKQLLQDGQKHSEEVRDKCLGGDFAISTSPTFDSTGELTGSVHIVRDITERKRAEEELQRTLKKLTDLESIINRSPAMVFLWPVQEGWPVEFVSDNVKDILGYTADDFMSGRVSWPGITHPEDVPRLEAEIAEYFKKGITEFNQEYRLIAKSGAICWMRDRNKVLLDSNGTPTHIQSIVLDVTNRKRVEEELQSAYQATRNILDKAPFGIYVVNFQGHVGYVNPAMLEIAGDTYQQFNNLNVIELPTYQKLGISEKIKNGLEGKYFKMKGVKYKSYYGNKTTIRNFIGIPLKEKGERKLLMIIEDITETKRTERALKKREAELESKTTSLEEVNTALRVMLKKKDEVKTEVEEKVLSNVKELVIPYLEKLKRSRLDVKQNTYLSILESSLNDITSSFSYKLSSNYLSLTPTEIQVANLIRHGSSTKEIAELMCLSKKTIDFHRNNIREKLGIKNQKANLRTHLASLP